LIERGFTPSRRLLAVLDGSAALKKAVRKFFPDAEIQRCLVHKERNIRARLSKRDWGELARHFKRLRQVQGAEAAERCKQVSNPSKKCFKPKKRKTPRVSASLRPLRLTRIIHQNHECRRK
jgi:transposase-like protein